MLEYVIYREDAARLDDIASNTFEHAETYPQPDRARIECEIFFDTCGPVGADETLAHQPHHLHDSDVDNF